MFDDSPPTVSGSLTLTPFDQHRETCENEITCSHASVVRSMGVMLVSLSVRMSGIVVMVFSFLHL